MAGSSSRWNSPSGARWRARWRVCSAPHNGMKNRPDDDLDREIRSHLDLDAEERMADGVPPDAARHAAVRAFGNVTRAKEVCYEMARFAWLDHVIQHLRFAWRQLRKGPGFAAAAILTLAPGIGFHTAVF